MNIPQRPFFLALLLYGFPHAVSAEDQALSPANDPLRKAATRLQVFLDKANFGPGKIDGRYGDFTHKALNLYRETLGLPSVARSEKPVPDSQPKEASAAEKEKSAETAMDRAKPEAEPFPDLQDMDLAETEPVFIDYKITEEDQKLVGDLPKEVSAMAKLKWLPYASLAEAVAEKFHCDLDFLKELNPGQWEKLKLGDTLTVPNVTPFELHAVKDLPLLDLAALDEENAEDDTDKAKSAKSGTRERAKDTADEASDVAVSKASESTIPAASDLAVKVNTGDSMLRLYEKKKLVAAYPVTIGSDQTESPQGEWKVKGIARLPDFRYDKKFLKTGERGSETYLLPPGPNNLVGVIWIATNRRGIGLHGTSEPDSIGRSSSHGCIRLANWDIVRLATRLRAGAKVSIH